ncbi:restriction endonuclease [Candidatus Leptofilum sp.]|uniref:restriction endonuclease n=1 Tax=Candidatus Leptofilum sp. TaxID=3241576 RepID=UPI003B5CC55B
MVVRTEWRFRQQSPRFQTQPRPAVSWHSRWIIGGLTAVYLFWLLVRAISQPAWLLNLSSVATELVRLVEIGWLATLLVLWGVVWWQKRQEVIRPFVPLTLDQLYNLQPAEFEQYVAQLFRQKKYRVTVRGRSGDLGVDLMLTRTGGKRAIVQCKRYRSTIGPVIVRELYGTLIHEGVAHAFLVTTANISDSARSWAQGKPMTLIDGSTLVEIAHSLQTIPTDLKSP